MKQKREFIFSMKLSNYGNNIMRAKTNPQKRNPENGHRGKNTRC